MDFGNRIHSKQTNSKFYYLDLITVVLAQFSCLSTSHISASTQLVCIQHKVEDSVYTMYLSSCFLFNILATSRRLFLQVDSNPEAGKDMAVGRKQTEISKQLYFYSCTGCFAIYSKVVTFQLSVSRPQCMCALAQDLIHNLGQSTRWPQSFYNLV